MYLAIGVPDLMRRALNMREMQRRYGMRENASVALFCALATESFLGDFKIICERAILPIDPIAPRLRVIADLLDEMESSRLPIRAKYGFLYYALSGKALPKGEQPYQDFDLLIRIRDSLVHYKSYAGHSFPDYLQKLLDQLVARKILTKSDIGPHPDWGRLLDQSDELGTWGIQTAKAIMKLVAEVAPQTESGMLHNVLETMYRD
jgi:hypothetical protein